MVRLGPAGGGVTQNRNRTKRAARTTAISNQLDQKHDHALSLDPPMG